MKRSLQVVGLATVLALIASVGFLSESQAQETRVSREGGSWAQEVTGSLTAVKILRVKVDMGSVVVRGGQQQGINYVVHTRFGNSSEQEARRQFEQYKVTAYVKGDTAWIVGDWQGGKHPRHFSGEFSVMVPREMALVKLETEGGNVDASGVGGRVEAQSGGGSMHLDDIGGGVSAETGGGSIDVGTVSGDIGLHTGGGSIEVRQANGKLIAETGGGSIEIQSCAQGAVIETGGSSITVRHCNGKVKATTGGGSVDVSDVGGPAEIETGGGSIRLTSAKGHVHAETGGGGVELYGVPSAWAETAAGGITVKLVNTGAERHDSDLETGAGDITVYIASDVAINVRASVDMGNGHQITSDFPDIHVSSEGGQWGPKTLTAEGRLNGGGPMLKVHTSTGDICIKRASH
ncbi:MAG TPA: hypothetical protein VE377_11735 [Candidatus Dormibacteraeota bacterium]|nr:hypothetical protein [Candidatus Dormibacteraeota bacterium]